VKKLLLLCSTAALCMPAAAFAQSTGTQTTEEEKEIVVTGTRAYTGVDGVVVPDSTKAREIITQQLISQQSPGQTILNVLNLVPSVNFTNSDPYGSSGGNIRMRGFDGNRISLTFDGVPLNDSGNYAIFSNQQLDPELVEQINVGLGVTDVDSPTASAAGGTINYRTLIPTDKPGFLVSGSIGDFAYKRVFGMIQTGELTSLGTKAWVSGSFARNDKFKGPGDIDKHQYNARIYQPIGSGGDFISVAGYYNKNRNNFYRNPSVNDLRALLGPVEISPSNANASANNPIYVGYFNNDQWDTVSDFENNSQCIRPTPNNGTAQVESTTPTGNTAICTNYYNVRINPSNTGNIRGQSRFTLTDTLILTVDPSYQYVLANGGGISVLSENCARARGSNPLSPGVDYNGDGDFLDRIQFYTPNNTNTNRYVLTSSLIWDVASDHRVRVAYTYDRAKHRQTGEWGYMENDGDPQDVFGGRDARPVLANDGFQIQQRDRKSIALLNQISGQYIGKFFDNSLRVDLGVRRPFFKRDLQTFCPVQASDGFAYCTSEPILPRGTVFVPPPGTLAGSIPIFVNQGDALPTNAAFRPLYAPFKSNYKYGKLLPNLGFTYRVAGPISIFGNYAKGFSAPRTDNLYRAPEVDVKPEQTNAFDLGARYTDRRVQAQTTLWKIDYTDRIVSSFNQELGISLDRNVGKVDSWGLESSVAYRVSKQLSLLALASYIDAELQDNVELGTTTSATPPAGQIFCDGPPTPAQPTVATCAPTKGKMITETPHWQIGGRANVTLGVFEFGLQGKRVGPRFATDTNDVKVAPYLLVDLDARLNLDMMGLDKSYLQFNLTNLLDSGYFGNISTQINVNGSPNFSVGSPRTFMASLNLAI